MHIRKLQLIVKISILSLLVFAILTPLTTTFAQSGDGSNGAASATSGGSAGGTTSGGKTGTLKLYKSWLQHGSYASAGVGMRNLGHGTISLAGVPAGATITAAYLYWTTIDLTAATADSQGNFDGNAITGGLLATSATPCWTSTTSTATPSARTYRADVTAFVTGSGDYTLDNFATGLTSGIEPSTADPYPLLDGASLVVIFQKGGYPNSKIMLYNGGVTLAKVGDASVTKLGSFPKHASYMAFTTFIGADGQTLPDGTTTFNGKKVSADWDGTDPGDINYAQGNLWDTERASTLAAPGNTVGAFIPKNAATATVKMSIPKMAQWDCLVHVAQVLAVSDGQIDSDGDSLRDSWEANGYDYGNNKTIDVNLPNLGASPFHKDIFEEIDWMTAGADEMRPDDTVINGLIAAYDAGNVSNVDGTTGIHIHINRSNSIPFQQNLGSSCTMPSIFGKLNSIKTANMPKAKWAIYHYQLWVWDQCPFNSSSGIARGIPSDDSVVSLGEWPSLGTDDVRIGTSMHELGHDLGLWHGAPNFNDPYAPNHLSIMSYLYQVSGLYTNGVPGLFEYQSRPLPSLDESCLNENVGVGTDAGLDTYGLVWNLNGFTTSDTTAGSANGPVDWNQDLSIGSCVAADINGDGTSEVLPATPNEWTLLKFNGGSVGYNGVSFSAPMQPSDEMDYPTYQKIAAAKAAQH